MDAFLARTDIVDFDAPSVAALARELAYGAASDEALVARAFAFVRDRIEHSVDFRRGPLTCRASEVLRHGTGFCYAKSHLLAAVLRANGVPTGFCYQRLSAVESGPPYCLHGLNGVLLRAHGWLRLDARGNKPGIDARFDPPAERLAFAARGPGERDLAGVHAEPLDVVLAAIARAGTWEALLADLPDQAPER